MFTRYFWMTVFGGLALLCGVGGYFLCLHHMLDNEPVHAVGALAIAICVTPAFIALYKDVKDELHTTDTD